MEQMPKITATITIVSTGEKTDAAFEDVIDMLATIGMNIDLAEQVYNRPIEPSDIQVEPDCDDAYFAYSFADTNELYMTVAAKRHFLQ